MSAERARLAAGLFAALGMLGAALTMLLSDRSEPANVVSKQVEPFYPSHGETIVDGFDLDDGCLNIGCLLDKRPELEAPHPRVRVDRPLLMTDYDRPTIRRFVRYHLDQITRCYDNRLRDAAGLTGTINVEFLITYTGEVHSAVAAGFDAELAICVAHVIGGIVFPKPTDLVQVLLPITFYPTATLARPPRYEDQWSTSSLRSMRLTTVPQFVNASRDGQSSVVHAPVTASLDIQTVEPSRIAAE